MPRKERTERNSFGKWLTSFPVEVTSDGIATVSLPPERKPEDRATKRTRFSLSTWVRSEKKNS